LCKDELIANSATHCPISCVAIKNTTHLSETSHFDLKTQVYYIKATNCPRVLMYVIVDG